MNDLAQPPQPAARLPALLAAVLLAALLIWGWFDLAARLDPQTGELLRSDDYHVYRAAALALRNNRSPYEAVSERGWPYLYPPLLAILIQPLTSLSPRAELYAWFLINVALALASALCLWRIAASAAPTPAAQRTVFIWSAALALLPLVETLHRGQVNVVILFSAALGMWLLQRRRPALAGFTLAAASAIKVTPLLIAVWLLWKLALTLVAPRGMSPRAPSFALLGFLIGVVFWWWGAPALTLGPNRATQCLIEFRAAVTQHYLTDDTEVSSTPEPDRAARMDFKRANQSWHHLFHRPLRDADPAHRRLADRALLIWLALLLVATLLLSRSRWPAPVTTPAADSPALLCELAVLLVLGLTAGRLAWNHSYLLAWPLLLFSAAAARTISTRARTHAPIIAALIAYSVLWFIQMTGPSLLGHYFPLLFSTSVLAAWTACAWRGRCAPNS